MPISFYALITPLAGGSGNRPDNSLPQPPEGGGGRPDNSLPPFPAHPIVIPPDSISDGVPSHPIFIPPIVEIPGFPTPPIFIPPDAIAPGVPSQPIYLPIGPDNSLPGEQPGPDQGLPGEQPEVDNSLPGAQPGPDQGLPPIQWPNLPEEIPDDAQAVVLVKTRGVEAQWYFLMEDQSLQPIQGGGSQQSQGKKRGRK